MTWRCWINERNLVRLGIACRGSRGRDGTVLVLRLLCEASGEREQRGEQQFRSVDEFVVSVKTGADRISVGRGTRKWMVPHADDV